MSKFGRKSDRVIAMLLGIAVLLCLFSPIGFLNLSSNAATDGLVLNKSYDATTGLLTLEAYVTGETVTTTYEHADPLDIVLVLDATTSMDWDANIATSIDQLNALCKDYADSYLYHTGFLKNYDMRFNESTQKWEYEKNDKWSEITEVTTSKYVKATRVAGLKGAATNFVRTVSSISPETKIGIVKFGYASGDKSTVLNTLTECNQAGCKSIVSSISTITAEFDSTNIGDGIDMGATLFDSTSNREKVMIVFTDGDPNANTAEQCIVSAYNAKQSDIKVYTIGIFSSSSTDRDKLMNRMSSKYPNATVNSKGTVVEGSAAEGTYYYPVTDSNNLDTVFQTIASSITSGGAMITTLTSETILRDIISNSFVYDSTDDKKTRVYLSDYIGENLWGTPVEITDGSIQIDYYEQTDTFDISGFDYSANWCGKAKTDDATTYRGKKIIVTIPIKPADGAIGATGVNTNAPGSGIIPKGSDKPIGEFPVPTTDIPTDIKITKKIEGYITDDATFSFDASVTSYITGYLAPDANNYSKATTEAKKYETFVLGKNQSSDVIKNVLVASDNRQSTVTVTEKKVPVGYLVTMTDGITSQTFTGTGADVSKTFSVSAGMEITVTNNKPKPSTSSVTFTNTVKGNMGDLTELFSYSGTYYSGLDLTQLSQSLKHGGSKKIENVDDGSTFTISQSSLNEYATVVLVNGVELKPKDNKYSFTVNEDTKVEFINTRNMTIPVGVILEYLPYVLILVVVVVGAVIIIIRKKRIVDDE